MKYKYRNHRFVPSQLRTLASINEIIDEYQEQGFILTVRQLYYQMVSRDQIPNSERSYKQLINTVTNGRMAGHIDWDMIEDRTRAFITRSRWDNPGEVLRASARQFHMDMWSTQPFRVYLVVEKEALVSVFERVCHQFDVPLLAARGYPSVSVIRQFAEEQVETSMAQGQKVVILHFGDHDPSGIDMTRDLVDRVNEFIQGEDWQLQRMALNMDQIKKLQPPPNPAKKTDARFKKYASDYGTQSSWELDALPPTYLENLAREAIQSFIEDEEWEERKTVIADGRSKLLEMSKQFDSKE